MANNIAKEELMFNDSPGVSSKGQPILGTLEGYCADTIQPTRNGRKYSEALWEKVFNSKIVQELFNCGGILGELDHPAERTELCTEKVAICMPEPPIKKDGKLWAKFDILDTPNGRIAATLAKYGYKLGVSSRGSGDTFIDNDGNESVDPDTYDFTCFDLVILPAVEAARLQFKESLESNKSLKVALSESLNKASEDDKKIMKETLENLHIDLNPEMDSNIEIEDDKQDTVDNNEVIVEQLQSILLEKENLEAKLIELQEKLSVCYTKESIQREKISKYKDTVSKLTEEANKAKSLSKKVDSLNNEILSLNSNLSAKDKKISRLQESTRMSSDRRRDLIENMNSKDKLIDKLNETISSQNKHFENEKAQLTETIAELNKDLSLTKSDCSKKISNANAIIEKYKKIATSAVDKYISSKAQMIGVSSAEIKNKLPESYNFSDIDSICEDLQNYKLTMSKLPFQTTNLKESFKIKANSSKNESIIPKNNIDDEVDDQLLRFIK